MASVVGLCNSALSKLGASRITSLTEGSKAANACNEQYEKVRDELLRAHTWNFATKRQKLARLSADPAFGFQYQYQLPSDWIRTVSAHDNEDAVGSLRYKLEQDRILTDATDVYLRYIFRVTDPNAMPADFQEALAWALAADICIAITQSRTLFVDTEKKATGKLRRAKSADAMEDYPDRMPESDWITARG